MRLGKFAKKKSKKNVMILSGMIIILLISSMIVYRTLAFYTSSEDFDAIKGQVPDQNYDTLFAFYQEDINGHQTFLTTIPEKAPYDVVVTCNKGATGTWDYEDWGPKISNLNQTRTKCNIIFSPFKPLKEYGILDTLTETGSGLYAVGHQDDNISYTSSITAVQNLRETEYRYAGKNPNNYIKFNNELWRIIGLVNTPEGQRLKLMRSESIGKYSWDSSPSNINIGQGVNEWSQSKIKNMLNNGPYYNRTTGTCYAGTNNQTVSCDFESTGLTKEAQAQIDSVTWNIGANGKVSTVAMTPLQIYSYERSNSTGKICTTGEECNDTVERTTSWQGNVGLISPSDYGYAMSGTDSTPRETCLNTAFYGLYSKNECIESNWMYNNEHIWTITPMSSTAYSHDVFIVRDKGDINNYAASFKNSNIFPVIHLKSSAKIVSGSGTKESPYILK